MDRRPTYEELEQRVKELEKEALDHRRIEAALGYQVKLFMESADPIIIEDLEGKVIDMNAEAELSYGWNRKELIGQPVKTIVPPERHEQADRLLARCRQGEPVRNVEGLRWNKAGKVIPVLFTLSLLTDEAGEPTAIATIAKNITSLKRTEAELEARVEDLRRFATVVSDSNDAIILHDLEGKILAWNRGAIDIYGYTETEALEMNVRDIVAETDRKAALTLIEKITQGETVKSFELRRVTKDNRILDVWLTTTLLTNEKGEPVAIATTERDITERKQAEKQLRESQKIEAVGVLAGGIAHDFNMLIGIISGYGDMLRDHLSEGSRPRNYLEEMMDTAHRSKELVKQLMNFARSEKAERKPLQLALSIEESLRLLRSSIRTTITFSQNIEAKSDTVLANSNQIQQVIMNLGINAGWAIGDKMGELGVSLTEVEVDAKLAGLKEVAPGPYLRLSVSDTGRGMDSELVEHIFEPFYTTKKVGEGSGLGLSVVHGIVKSHGGFVTVDSEPAKGSTFHVYLPKIQEKDVVIEEGEI